LFCECDGWRYALITFRLQNNFAIDVLDERIVPIKSISCDAQIKKNEMVEAYGMYGGVERHIKGLGVQT
jgi:hypothetical protein